MSSNVESILLQVQSLQAEIDNLTRALEGFKGLRD